MIAERIVGKSDAGIKLLALGLLENAWDSAVKLESVAGSPAHMPARPPWSGCWPRHSGHRDSA